MNDQLFSQWGYIFALAGSAAVLALGIIVFYATINDRKAGIPVVVGFVVAGIGKAAKFYMLSAVAVLIMLPMVIYFSWRNRKQPIIWINWGILMVAAPATYYAYRVLYSG